jgi:hypothetical protein
MAEAIRHAAWQTVYEVRETRGTLDLGTRYSCADFLEAVEFALDYLVDQDPERSGLVRGLRVDRVRGEARSAVWRYDSEDAQEQADEPTRIWGFDITRRWRGPTGRAA